MTINRHAYAFFEDATSKIGKTGLTDVAFTIKSVRHSDSSVATVVNGVTGFEVGVGVYAVLVSALDFSLYDYMGSATTASTATTSKTAPTIRWGDPSDLIDELKNIAGAAGYDRTSNSMEALGSASSPSVGDIDSQLSTTHGAGSWLTGGGTGGSLSLLYTLTDSVTSLPIVGATIELYPTDAYSGVPIDSKVTNTLGQVTFSNLVAGTYYLKCIRSGYEDGYDVEVVA